MSEISEDKDINESTDVFKQATAAWGSSSDTGMDNPAFFPAETTSPFVFPPTQSQNITQVASEVPVDGEKKKKRKPKKPPKVPKRQSPPDSG